MQVARDPVPLLFDRGVGPAEQARAVLVAILQELEQRSDGLVGHFRGGDVADQQQGAGRRGPDLRDARLEVERLPVGPVDGGRTAGRELAERGIGARDDRGERVPGGALDRGAVAPDHRAERVVRPVDRPVGVELDEPVHGGLEDEPQVLLGPAQGLVRLAEPYEGAIGLREGGPPLLERGLRRGVVGVRAALVDEHPGDEGGPERREDERGLRARDPLADVDDRDRAIIAPAAATIDATESRGRPKRTAGRTRRGSCRTSIRVAPSAIGVMNNPTSVIGELPSNMPWTHVRPNPMNPRTSGRVREEQEQVPRRRHPHRQRGEAGEDRGGDRGEHEGRHRHLEGGAHRPHHHVDERGDRQGHERHVGRDVPAFARIEVGAELRADRERERDEPREEDEVEVGRTARPHRAGEGDREVPDQGEGRQPEGDRDRATRGPVPARDGHRDRADPVGHDEESS